MKIVFEDKDLSKGSFIPEGEHEVVVSEIETTTSKAGNPMIVVTMIDRLNRSAKEFFMMKAESKWKLGKFAMACGVQEAALKKGIELDDLKGKKVLMVKAQTGVRMYEGKEVKDFHMEFYPAKDSAPATKKVDDFNF